MSIMEMDNHQSPFRLWIMVVVKKYIDELMTIWFPTEKDNFEQIVLNFSSV